MTLHEQIKQARIKAGMTQKQLADAIGSYKANVSNIEAGKGNPTLHTLEEIANVLKCELRINTCF